MSFERRVETIRLVSQAAIGLMLAVALSLVNSFLYSPAVSLIIASGL